MLSTVRRPSDVLPGMEHTLLSLPTKAGHVKPHETPGPELLQALFQELCAAFAEAKSRDGRIVDNTQPAESFERLDGKVKVLMREYCDSQAADWRGYVHFNKLHYVRHLIDDCEDFELLLVCWAPGQGSHVHDHGLSHCWLTCLQGELEEQRYEDIEDDRTPKAAEPPAIPGVESVAGPCPMLMPCGTATLTPGQTGYISDRIALHAVRCPEGVPAPGAVSLHLYAPPIRRVRLFDPEDNRVVVRRPGFWSVRGTRT